MPEQRQSGDVNPRIVGYRVSNVVQVRVREADGVGRIVDGAVTAGANVVGHVQFTLADPSKAEAQARALAVQDAAAKASLRPPFTARVALASAPGPVEPGQLEVIVSVEARYAIEP